MGKMNIGKRFEGKVAIVTGSTQGIGFAIAERLGSEGAAVVVSSRRQENVDEAVRQLKARGIQVLGLVCHVSNAEQRKDLIQKTVQKYQKIDIVVLNAAISLASDKMLQAKEWIFDKTWETNVKAAVLLLQQAAPHLHKGSSVVFVSSIGGYRLQSSLGVYGISKTALLALTKALAAEMAPDTRVNCIAPGFVPTNMTKSVLENEKLRKQLESGILLDRHGTPEDMAAAVAFLASDDASYITGETLVVAGGMPSRL